MNSSVRVGSLGPLTVVPAGCELERSERSSSQRSSYRSRSMATAHCLSMNSLAHSGRATPRVRRRVSWRQGVAARRAGTFYDVWQTDGDLFTLRAHGDTCCAGRDGMPDRQRGAEQLAGSAWSRC